VIPSTQDFKYLPLADEGIGQDGTLTRMSSSVVARPDPCAQTSPGAEWITISAPPRGRERRRVDLYAAVRWIRVRAPLKDRDPDQDSYSSFGVGSSQGAAQWQTSQPRALSNEHSGAVRHRRSRYSAQTVWLSPSRRACDAFREASARPGWLAQVGGGRHMARHRASGTSAQQCYPARRSRG
jgi:hypothetical protein